MVYPKLIWDVLTEIRLSNSTLEYHEKYALHTYSTVYCVETDGS